MLSATLSIIVVVVMSNNPNNYTRRVNNTSSKYLEHFAHITASAKHKTTCCFELELVDGPPALTKPTKCFMECDVIKFQTVSSAKQIKPPYKVNLWQNTYINININTPDVIVIF